MVFVSSPMHIKELDKAPDTVLSLNGAAKHVSVLRAVYRSWTRHTEGRLNDLLIPSHQMLQPLYTMNGFNWFDRRGIEGVGFVRTLRSLLTNNLPRLLPDLGRLTRIRWAELLSERAKVNGLSPSPLRDRGRQILI
jgi:hypothetical protein